MTKIKDLPKHKRPREKLLEKGPENLSKSELLAILLRTGTSGKSALEISKIILKKHKLEKLLSVQKKDLEKIKGISNSKICTILSAFELSKRATKSFKNTLPIIDSPQRAVDQLTNIRNKSKEHFVTLYLNARSQLVQKEIVSIGTIRKSLIHPREVFYPAIKKHSVSLILAHNHPSGDPKPSDQDIQVTEDLNLSGKILDIEIKDHIIVTKDSFISMKEHGYL